MPGNIRLWGTTGYVELAAPATGNNATLTLPTDSIQSGLILIVNQDFSSTNLINVNNCFSSNYDNYRILLNIYSSSADDGLRLRLRSGTSDDSSANYSWTGIYATSSATGTEVGGTGQTGFHVGAIFISSGGCTAIELHRPFQTRTTHYSEIGTRAEAVLRSHAGAHALSNSYNGFSIFGTANPTLNGNLKVYGYRNSTTA